MERDLALAHISALVVVAVWGTTFVVSKDLMAFMSPLQLMCIRFFLAFVALWIVYPKWNFNWRNEIIFIPMALFGNTIYFLAENTALTITYSSNVAILASTTSLMSLALMWVLRKEPVRKSQTIGFVIAFTGVILVILNGAVILHLEPLGDLLVLGAALSWAIYGLFLKKYSDRFDNFLISRKVMFYGFLSVIPLVLIEGRPFDTGSFFTVTSILEILFLAILGSCVCYIFWNNCIKKLGVVTTNSYLYIMPLVTMIAGSIMFNETITIMAITGTALVIIGLAISNRKVYTE